MSEINRMDHIKDIILMLSEYVRVGEVEKKKFGEVMTPLELVKEMLNTLPEDYWTNPNLKILDPANGIGPFPTMVIYKLMDGLKEWEPDEEKRYKHIVENMIYVCEIQPKNMFLWLCAVDPFNEYKCNNYTGSFLEDGFDKHMKDVWGVEKFDLVVGNPPYNDSVNKAKNNKSKNLYDKFIIKSSKITSKVLKVIPARWQGIKNMDKFKKYCIDYGIEFIKNIDDKLFNSVNIDGGVCILYLNSEIKHTKISVNKNDNIIIKLRPDYPIIINKNSKIIYSILDKVSNFDNISTIYQNPQRIKSNDKRLVDGKINENNKKIMYEVLLSKNIIKLIPKNEISKIDVFHIDKYRVSFERVNGGFKKTGINRLKILEPGKITSQSISFFITKDENDANKLLFYLNTKFANFLRDINQFDKNFTSLVFDKIPLLYDKIENDIQNVYKILNLTANEIKLIENFNI